MSDYVKVHHAFEEGDGIAGESLWAKPTDQNHVYEIANIPFFANYGMGDLVYAIEDENGILEILYTVTASGNVTVRFFFHEDMDAAQRTSLGQVLRAIHDDITWEWGNGRLLALSLPDVELIHDVVVIIPPAMARCELILDDDVGEDLPDE